MAGRQTAQGSTIETAGSVLAIGVVAGVWLVNWDGITTYWQFYFPRYGMDPSPIVMAVLSFVLAAIVCVAVVRLVTRRVTG